MKKNINYKSGFIIEHDIAFVFAGLGTVIIGISILTIINKGNNKNQ